MQIFRWPARDGVEKHLVIKDIFFLTIRFYPTRKKTKRKTKVGDSVATLAKTDVNNLSKFTSKVQREQKKRGN